MTDTNFPIYIGGDVAIEDLANYDNISDYVNTGRVGWYIQESDYYNMVNNGTIAQINKNFGYTNIEAELNLQNVDGINNWINIEYIPVWLGQGLKITQWNSIINFNDTNWFANFKATVSAVISAVTPYGVTSIAPIYSPNPDEGISGSTTDDFYTSSNYSDLRTAALLGKGLTLDTPPWYAWVRNS